MTVARAAGGRSLCSLYMDWRVYHSVNRFVVDHAWLGRLFHGIETYGTYAIGIAAVLLWIAARPGGDRKWKIAAGSALGAAALALLANKVISSLWHRDRPFQTHHVAHIWGPRKTDASFPSDHASASFAIAMAIMLIDPLVGAVFTVLALLISIGRVVIGEHYPGDVLAGALIGTAAAVVVVRLGRPVVLWLVRLVERVTDPILASVRGRGAVES